MMGLVLGVLGVGAVAALVVTWWLFLNSQAESLIADLRAEGVLSNGEGEPE